MALMSLLPLSGRYTTEFPHVFESSGVPPVPKPILESQLEQLLLLKIPILDTNSSFGRFTPATNSVEPFLITMVL